MEILDLTIKLDIKTHPEDLTNLAEEAYKVVLQAEANYLNFEDAEIHIWVEQGSVNYRTKIYIGLVTFVNVLAGFDGFVGGLEKCYDYSTKAMNYITEHIIEPSPNKVLETRRSAGVPEKVTKILKGIQQGKLTPEEGTKRVMKLLDEEAAEAKLKEDLAASFLETAQLQYQMPATQLKMFIEEEAIPEKKTLPTRKSLPKPPEPVLRGVELVYDRRTGKKEIKTYIK